MAGQVNMFTKGIVSDMDPILVESNQWVFPTVNVRFINREGQGVTAIPLDSNTHQTNGVVNGTAGEEFLLRPGYILIGVCEHNGIAYLIMNNMTTGEGEIGTFPSPRAITSFNINTGAITINQGLTGFNRVYRPLVNYTGLDTNYSQFSRQAFNSVSFNFSKRVDVFARPDYDDSVNLYIADHVNPNRHINVGFNQTGQLLTDRLYCINDFGSKLNLMPQTNSNIDVDDFWIETYGGLKHGNYTFFFQYATKNFDKTEMVTECGPIQIDDSGDKCRNSFGGKAIESSNKKIRFKLSNLDRTYPFVRVGYTRYFSDPNSPILSEYVIIERYYPIDNNTIEINVTGNEASYPISASEFLSVFPEERICKSHDDSDNRYFGGNWKSEDYDYEFLQQFFSKVELKWEDGRVPGDPTAHAENRIYGGAINLSDIKSNSQNRDAKITFAQTGYFRSEIYPFACIVELPNGSYTAAFLPRGIDSLNLSRSEVDDEYDGVTAYGKTNTQGFLRFPSSVTSNPFIGCRYSGITPNYDMNLYVLSVKYDFTKAITWLNTLPPEQQTAFHSIVRRIHFVRGDRFINIRYQGLMIAACRSHGNETEAAYTDMCTLPFPGTMDFGPPGVSNNGSAFALGQGRKMGHPSIAGFYPAITGSGNGGQPYGQAYYDYEPADNSMFNTPTNNSWWTNDSNADFYYREVMAPIFRGYTAMNWYKKNTANHNLNDDKDRVVNYASRFYLSPNYYGFFSPDFLANPNNDLAGIKHMFRVAKTMNTQRNVWNQPDSIMFKNIYPLARDGWSPTWSFANSDNSQRLIYPRGYAFDALAYFYYDGMLNNPPYLPDEVQDFRRYWNDFTMMKIGESSNVAVQDALLNSKKFINYSADFFKDRHNCMFYGEKVMSRDLTISNRSFYIPKYIGIHTTLDWYDKPWTGNYNLDIVNLCNQNPEDIIVANIGDPLSIAYKKIGKPMTYNELFFNDERSAFVFSGDCFLQRVYFKQMYWDGSSFGSSTDHQNWEEVQFNDEEYDNPANGTSKNSYFTHGILLSIVVECAHNINMRVPGEKTTFFPKTDKFEFVRRPFNEEGVESWQTNNGYDRILSDRSYFSFDTVVPKYTTNFPQRIRHSDRSTNGEFEDAFRNIKLDYFKDFDAIEGPINSIRDFNGTLFSIQETSINRHFTNQEQIKTTATTNDLILGIGPIIAQQKQKLADYGTHDQFSVVKGQRGIYGIDAKRKILWRATTASTAMGTVTGAIQNLTSEKMNETEMDNIIELFTTYSDIISGQADNTLNGIGIHSGYDKEYNEVLFTFMYRTGINRNPIGKTLVFSEKLDQFTGEYRFYPAIWFNINNDLFSTLSNAEVNKSMAFRHNQKDSCLMFYGMQDEMELSIIVNGSGSEGVGPTTEKEFLAYNIDSLQHEFSAVRYQTEFQLSDKIPFRENARFWANPEYLEHTWQCPVFVKTDATNQAFQPNSSMRGKWMKLTLFYRQNIPTFVKTILSFFNSSHA